MSKKFVLITILIVLLVLTVYSVLKIPSNNDDKLKVEGNSPVEVLQNYWSYSKQGNFTEVNKFVDTVPEIYYFCYSETPRQCKEKKEKEKKSEISNSDTFTTYFDLENTENSERIRKNVPNGIYKGIWQSYSIENIWIYEDEARIRINIKGDDFTIIQDVLLTKQSGSWKVFTLTFAGARDAFAPPLQN